MSTPGAGCCPSPSSRPAPAEPTRTLYTYHRDDAATVTRIQINAARTRRHALSPFVMGNFLEHLGQLVDLTLGANPLINPNLERSDPQETEPPYWDDAGAASWREDGGLPVAACVRLAAPDGTLSQRLYLPVRRERRYTLTFFTRGDGPDHGGPARAATTSTVRLWSDAADGRGDGLAESRRCIGPSRRAPLAVGQPARFVLGCTGGGPVDVDWVRLMPDDAVDGMDPDVLKLAQAWDIPLLRLAGNFREPVPLARWRRPAGQPPDPPQRRLGRPESNQFGTDEFLDLCRRLGAVPQFGANAGNGTPDEAAAWVEVRQRQDGAGPHLGDRQRAVRRLADRPHRCPRQRGPLCAVSGRHAPGRPAHPDHRDRQGRGVLARRPGPQPRLEPGPAATPPSPMAAWRRTGSPSTRSSACPPASAAPLRAAVGQRDGAPGLPGPDRDPRN